MKKYMHIVALALFMCALISCSANEGEVDVEGVKMIAVVKAIDDKIEVEVVEGEYGALGIYWVNVGPDTVYINENGNRVLKSTLKTGDTIEITYGGQVMMSYPPQIVAKIIKIK